MSSTPPALPLDIWLYISELFSLDDADDISALQVLSRVSKFMVPICRRKLFSKLSLSYHPGESRQNRYLDILKCDPNISCYLKDLRYIPPITTNKQETSADQILELLKTHASTLQILDIDSSEDDNSDKGDFDWNTLPNATQDALVTLIQKPTIRKLILVGLSNFPISSIALCEGLENLTLGFLGVAPCGTLPVRSRVPAPRHLNSYEKSSAAMEVLMSCAHPSKVPIVNLTRVKSAYIELDHDQCSLEPLYNILEKADRLSSLELDIVGPLPFKEIGARLAANPNQTITSVAIAMAVTSDTIYPLGGLNHALRIISGNNVLEQLDVDVDVETDENCRTDSEDWADLDAVLGAPGAFPALRRVNVNLNWGSHSRTMVEYVTELAGKLKADRFPLLAASKLISFELQENHEYVI